MSNKFKGAKNEPKTFDFKNRYGDIYTFTEMEDGNVLMEGPFVGAVRQAFANDFTDAYMQYQEDGGELTLKEFSDSIGDWMHDHKHPLNKYAHLLCGNPGKILMIDPSGGPYIQLDSTMYTFGSPIIGFQNSEKGYILLTEKGKEMQLERHRKILERIDALEK